MNLTTLFPFPNPFILPSANPPQVAAALAQTLPHPPISSPSHLHAWVSSQWRTYSPSQLEDELWNTLAQAQIAKSSRAGTIREPFVVTPHVINGVRSALFALTRRPDIDSPSFLLDPPPFNPLKALAFQNAVLDLQGSQNDNLHCLKFIPRDHTWFGPVLPVPLDLAAACPLWEKCLSEWSCNEANWPELLERMLAAALIGFRKFARIPVQYGLARSGKSTCTQILRALATTTYTSISIQDAISPHAMKTLVDSTIVTFSEVGELEDRERHRFAALLRTIVGGDTVTVNPKHLPMFTAHLRCFPFIQTHYLPDLPNEQGGLSTKVLPIRFRASFAKNPNLDLYDQLLTELPGIALRIARAGVRLLHADPADRWPVTEGSRELQRRIEVESNPVDHFLDWGFVRTPDLTINLSVVHELRDEWEALHNLRIRGRTGERIPAIRLAEHMEERSSWNITKFKHPDRGWCLKGCSMKPR